jgi:hypothetical protein
VRIQIFSKAILAAAVGSTLGIGFSVGQETQQQAQNQQQASPWKDIAEYDLYQQIIKATDPKEKLRLLEQWKQKYPDSKLKIDRLQIIMATYQQLQDPANMGATAQQILSEDPREPRALWALTLLANGTEDAARLDAGEKAAKTIVDDGDAVFAAAKKPAGTDDAAWSKFRTETTNLAYRTLGWIYTVRKNYPDADKQLHEYLARYPNDGQAAYWLGRAIIMQQQPERQAEGLFYIARAAALDGAGALDATARKQVQAYLDKAYKSFHGDDPEGLQHLLALAKANAAPPADFKILSAAEILAEKEKELAATDPSLALWLRLKGALAGTDGEQYFESSMKDALVPPEGQPAFKGYVIKVEPPRNPKTIILGVSSKDVADATITLDEAMTGTAEPGTLLEFRGVAKSFTREPFMLNFEAEKANISGWPAPAKKAPVKKAPPKKK